jgi:selenocysteine-specific elongation factor
MKNIVLGTAGHVDHGKTALIKAITNVDTDRLKEEKERGITIELGFAPLTLKSGQRVGIIDVPGHEKFVKNMVAGAGGIDVVIMVIAADEGIMPQTREHMEICELLAVKEGLVALTKADLVNDEWIGLVKEDIENFLQDTFLENAPIIPISSVTSSGIPEFLDELNRIVERAEEHIRSSFFRLPVDRVFTMKGFGTVVTGTLISGKATVGDVVEFLPSQKKAKIRGLQVHNETAENATTGQRTAINLQGISKTAIRRGDLLACPNTFEPSNRFDVLLRYLPSARAKIKDRVLTRFHIGTAQVLSRLILLGKKEIKPGEDVYARVYLESPVAAMAGDRFVIRSYSPVTTIGGGKILDPLVIKKRQTDQVLLAELELLDKGDERVRTGVIMERAGLTGISIRHLSVRTGIALERQKKILEEMLSKGEAILLEREPQTVMSPMIYKSLRERILLEAKTYHEMFPLKNGFFKEELRVSTGDFIDQTLFNRAIRDLGRDGKIVVEKDKIRLQDHRVDLKGDLEKLREEIENIYLNAGLTPSATKDVLSRFPGKKKEAGSILTVLVHDGILVKVNEDMYFHRESIDGLEKRYRKLLNEEGKSSPATFRDLTGLSRKYAIPLIEYFDKTKLTIRVGDHRVLRGRSIE